MVGTMFAQLVKFHRTQEACALISFKVPAKYIVAAL